MLSRIHSLSDATRYLIAAGCLVISGIAVFAGWSMSVSNRLVVIRGVPSEQTTTISSEQGNRVAESGSQPAPLSPVENLGESFKGLERFLPQPKEQSAAPKQQSWLSAITAFGSNTIKAGGQVIGKAVISVVESPALPAMTAWIGRNTRMIIHDAASLASAIRQYAVSHFSRSIAGQGE